MTPPLSPCPLLRPKQCTQALQRCAALHASHPQHQHHTTTQASQDLASATAQAPILIASAASVQPSFSERVTEVAKGEASQVPSTCRAWASPISTSEARCSGRSLAAASGPCGSR